MSNHAALPPSSAKEWLHCHGWLAMHRDLPQQEQTDEARWGTQCHDAAEQWLNTGDCPTLDRETKVVASEYVRYCLDLPGEQRGVETRVTTTVPDVWGTCDYWCYDKVAHALYIVDLKTGRVPVEADDPQLVLYADGVIEYLNLDRNCLTVQLAVVQPRAYHPGGPVRTAKLDQEQLREQLRGLRAAAIANRDWTGQVSAGKHCQNCKARTTCPAAIRSGQALPYAVTEAVPVELTPGQAGALLVQTHEAIAYLQRMERAYAGQVEGHIAAGRVVPGWSMRTSWARSKQWTIPEQDVEALGAQYGVDLYKHELITPTQAEQKGVPKQVIAKVSQRVQSGVKLSRVDTDDVARIFGVTE